MRSSPTELRAAAPRRRGLTLRETEIAHFILEGHANEAIARRLGITLATVKEHVTAIYRKVGAQSRAEFFALVFGRARP